MRLGYFFACSFLIALLFSVSSPKIIDYSGYDVSLRELADSMKVEGVVLSHVFEVGTTL